MNKPAVQTRRHSKGGQTVSIDYTVETTQWIKGSGDAHAWLRVGPFTFGAEVAVHRFNDGWTSKIDSAVIGGFKAKSIAKVADLWAGAQVDRLLENLLP